MGPDRVRESYAETKGIKKLSVWVDIEINDDYSLDWINIEREPEALIFLGKLLIAQAKYKKDCKFTIGPNTAGNIFFNKKKSTHELCKHRIPCEFGPLKKRIKT